MRRHERDVARKREFVRRVRVQIEERRAEVGPQPEFCQQVQGCCQPARKEAGLQRQDKNRTLQATLPAKACFATRSCNNSSRELAQIVRWSLLAKASSSLELMQLTRERQSSMVPWCCSCVTCLPLQLQ